MIPQITTPKILHGQIQMLAILKALHGINNKVIPHLIEQNLLINNRAHTLLNNDPKLNKKCTWPWIFTSWHRLIEFACLLLSTRSRNHPNLSDRWSCRRSGLACAIRGRGWRWGNIWASGILSSTGFILAIFLMALLFACCFLACLLLILFSLTVRVCFSLKYWKGSFSHCKWLMSTLSYFFKALI